jgi:site-specific recombinase XerD
MFQKLFCTEATIRRHREAPFALERERYLQHCSDSGATTASLHVKSNEILWIASLLPDDAAHGVDMSQLQEVVRQRKLVHTGATTGQRVVDIARPWLRFLGWWRMPTAELPFQGQLDRYVNWMCDERGFSPSTVAQWKYRTKIFLQWCADTNRPLGDLTPSDIDCYFVEGATRWCRISAKGIAAGLRVFLRYSATQGACDSKLAQALRTPRAYALESLPYAPGWDDVQRILATTTTSKPSDIRNRAILMLLSIYGLRRGEVASLRMNQVDWQGRVLQVFRLKRRQPQVYPLLPSVAEALSQYIDLVRPSTSYPEIFIGLHSPQRPLTPQGIYSLVNRIFKTLNIHTAHRGPHALRHACAARLVAQGITFKEIGDHLGHHSTAATMIYAKVDMVALREVGDFDLGELL